MTKDFHVPQARTWREIPQPILPRTMSGSGRWRLVFATLRGALAVTVLAGVIWSAAKVVAVVQENSRKMPAVAKAVPIARLTFTTDGVLDDTWAARTLALRPGISLMELDLQQLRAALLASTQVATATLTRNFPATLVVSISERTPVARVLARWPDGERPLFVARDGSVFAAVNLDPAMVRTLPWLDGVALVRRGRGFHPIAGMETVADLLVTAKMQAAPLYQDWNVVSLARFATDGELKVRTSRNLRVLFGTTEDYFRQLARLDLLLDTIAQSHPEQVPSEINLAIGSQVPVAFADAPALGETAPAPGRAGGKLPGPAPASAAANRVFLQLSPPREL